MFNRSLRPILFAISLFLSLHLPAAPAGQLVLGQYEDEAPLRTWNLFGVQAAAALGRGDTGFAIPAQDPSAALINPALLVDLSGWRVMVNGMFLSASLRKFSIINTGVLATEENIFLNLYGLDMGGVSFAARGWAMAFNAYLSEVYDRPSTAYEYFYRNRLYYRINFNQEGLLRTYHLSLARRLGPRLRAGIGLNFVEGELSRKIEEQWAISGIAIRDSKKQEFSGFFINGGLAARLTERLDLALVFRTPYRKKSPSQSELVYDAPPEGLDVTISASATSRYNQPLVLGLGANYDVSNRLKVGADISFFNWASYRVDYFEEQMDRNFRNTFKATVGAEWSVPVRLFRKEVIIPLRFGLGWDEQPMKEPRSTYTIFSLGAGFHWNFLGLDSGFSFGRENGSGDSLEARRIALSMTLKF